MSSFRVESGRACDLQARGGFPEEVTFEWPLCRAHGLKEINGLDQEGCA